MLCKLTVLSELTMGMSVYGYMCTGQVTKSCPALCDAMDSPVFSINGIAWAKYWSQLPFPSPGHPGGSSQVMLVVKNLPASSLDIRDVGLIPGSVRSPGGVYGSPLQYSCLKNSMDRGALGYSPWDRKESNATQHTACMHMFVVCVDVCMDRYLRNLGTSVE